CSRHRNQKTRTYDSVELPAAFSRQKQCKCRKNGHIQRHSERILMTESTGCLNDTLYKALPQNIVALHANAYGQAIEQRAGEALVRTGSRNNCINQEHTGKLPDVKKSCHVR